MVMGDTGLADTSPDERLEQDSAKIQQLKMDISEMTILTCLTTFANCEHLFITFKTEDQRGQNL